MPCWHASKTGRGRSAGCDVPASLDDLFTDALAQQEVGVVEILEKLGEERVAVCGNGLLDSFEDTAVNALRIVCCLQQERWDSGNDYRLADALRSVFPKVSCHFAPTHGETDQREITQFEMCHEFVQVLGEGVVVVALCWLAGFAETSAIISDDTVTCSQ